jgi:phosphomannomutase
VTKAAELARRWMAADPDPVTRAETAALLAGAPSEVEARFTGRLQFGPAGLRGALGAGPQRMNRLLVRQAAAGLGRHVLAQASIASDPGAAAPVVVIAYDARVNSDVFAHDSARVLAALGIRVVLADGPLPTPVLAFATMQLGAAAGVMVTASHNPPGDNGYKVFLPDGSQIVSPIDVAISASIDAVDATTVALVDLDHRITTLDPDIVDRYVAGAAAARVLPDLRGDLTVAYTPLHGVGRDTLLGAFAVAALPAPVVVACQADPDGNFPTVAFPNPEEPGALDELLRLASSSHADLAIANDPDADRLGAAIPTSGGWRTLRGDEIGWLLADHILRHGQGDDRFVVTTLVSSSLLADMAAHYGVHAAETYTGFKWIAAERRAHPEWRFVFGYEQALGFAVTGSPADKDGISAAVLLAEVALLAKTLGITLEDRLAAIATQYGRRRLAERSLAMPTALGLARVAALDAAPPSTLAGHPVTDVVEFPEANLVRFQCGPHARVQVRPSGTEPKVKIYAEAIDADVEALIDAITRDLMGYSK